MEKNNEETNNKKINLNSSNNYKNLKTKNYKIIMTNIYEISNQILLNEKKALQIEIDTRKQIHESEKTELQKEISKLEIQLHSKDESKLKIINRLFSTNKNLEKENENLKNYENQFDEEINNYKIQLLEIPHLKNIIENKDYDIAYFKKELNYNLKLNNDLKKEHENKIVDLQKDSDDKIADLQKDYENKIAYLQKEHENKIAYSQKDSQKKIANLQKDLIIYDEKICKLLNEIKTYKTNFKKDLVINKFKISKYQNEIYQKNKEIKNICIKKKKLKNYETENQNLKKEISFYLNNSIEYYNNLCKDKLKFIEINNKYLISQESLEFLKIENKELKKIIKEKNIDFDLENNLNIRMAESTLNQNLSELNTSYENSKIKLFDYIITKLEYFRKLLNSNWESNKIKFLNELKLTEDILEFYSNYDKIDIIYFKDLLKEYDLNYKNIIEKEDKIEFNFDKDLNEIINLDNNIELIINNGKELNTLYLDLKNCHKILLKKVKNYLNKNNLKILELFY